MTTSHSSFAPHQDQIRETSRALSKLYFIRASFSLVWVISVLAFTRHHPFIATILFIVYPAWDALATFADIRSGLPGSSKTAQYVNAVISTATTLAVVLALRKGIAEALTVIGIWAILTGLIQFLLGFRRRKQMGGQWPMMISGGQSMLGGTSFILLAHAPASGINSLAGYAAFGAFYFLLAGIRLTKEARQASLAA